MTIGMPVPVSALYLAIFAVFATVLAFLPGRIRGADDIPIGDGGRRDLLLHMRRHANFVEYVPYFMLMLVALELNGTSDGWLHGLGMAMVLARIAHAIGIKEDTTRHPLRAVGAGGTMLASLVAAVMLAGQFFRT